MTYSLLINETWTCMFKGDCEDARKHAKKVDAKEIRLYSNGRYLGQVNF